MLVGMNSTDCAIELNNKIRLFYKQNDTVISHCIYITQIDFPQSHETRTKRGNSVRIFT